MATSVWQCLGALVAMREADIFDQTGAGMSDPEDPGGDRGRAGRSCVQMGHRHQQRHGHWPPAPDAPDSIHCSLREADDAEVSQTMFSYFLSLGSARKIKQNV